MRLSHALVAGVLVGSGLSAQLQPGQSLVTVSANGVGEIYLVDHGTQKATQMQIPGALSTGIANCITMVNPVLGYVGTTGVAGTTPADVYRITLAGNTVKATKLNSSALGGYNVAQIAVVGGTLYFNSGSAQAATAGWDGWIYSMPASGGAPTALVDLSKLPNWPANTTANALCSDGKKLYFATWPGGDLYAYDFATKLTSKLATLPGSKYPIATFYPVNMHMMPAPSTELYIVSLYGDVLVYDTATQKVSAQYFCKTPTLTGGSLYKNAGYYNPATGDFLCATRDGHVDVLSTIGGGQSSPRDIAGIGTGATPSTNSTTGIYYYGTSRGSGLQYGSGCAGSGSFVPTTVLRGVPSVGNKNFALGLGDGMGGAIAVAFIGIGQLKIDLSSAGAPGCTLLQDLALPFPVQLSGSLAGFGQAQLPVPLPAGALDFQLQFAVLDKAGNSLGIVMSDARKVMIR